MEKNLTNRISIILSCQLGIGYKRCPNFTRGTNSCVFILINTNHTIIIVPNSNHLIKGILIRPKEFFGYHLINDNDARKVFVIIVLQGTSCQHL